MGYVNLFLLLGSIYIVSEIINFIKFCVNFVENPERFIKEENLDVTKLSYSDLVTYLDITKEWRA